MYVSTEKGREKIWSLSGEKGAQHCDEHRLLLFIKLEFFIQFYTYLVNVGLSWLKGMAPFKTNLLHQLIIEGIRGETDTGDIVINDIF